MVDCHRIIETILLSSVTKLYQPIKLPWKHFEIIIWKWNSFGNAKANRLSFKIKYVKKWKWASFVTDAMDNGGKY